MRFIEAWRQVARRIDILLQTQIPVDRRILLRLHNKTKHIVIRRVPILLPNLMNSYSAATCLALQNVTTNTLFLAATIACIVQFDKDITTIILDMRRPVVIPKRNRASYNPAMR